MPSRLRRHFSIGALAILIRKLPLARAFALGFVVIAVALQWLLPKPLTLYVAERSEKLAMLENWQARATAAAFGNSRVHVGFDPRAFDDEFRGAPYAVRSLNLAIFGSSQTEQRILAREFLRRLKLSAQAPQDCIALLQLDAGVNFGLVDLFHPRSIDLYDLDTTEFAVMFSDSSIGVIRLIGRTGVAITSAALHFMNLGMLGDLLFHSGLDAKILHAEYDNDRRGMLIMPQETEVSPGVAPIFARPRVQPAPFNAAILPGNYTLLADLASAAGSRPVQFVYFTLPTLDDLTRFPVYPATIEGPMGSVPIVNLRQVDKYPELFQPELWWDPGHLNDRGAALATRLLAREVKAWIADHPAASRCGD